jgi:succinate dehydrogenase / fumarate reductase membrane anchor subunit
MVKSVLGGSQGLRDWVVQRVSALVLGVYLLGLAYFFLTHPALNFLEWRQLFSYLSMRVATLLFVVALAMHAWVGIWTVVTDYVKLPALRFVVHVAVALTLIACLIWAQLIMWRP